MLAIKSVRAHNRIIATRDFSTFIFTYNLKKRFCETRVASSGHRGDNCKVGCWMSADRRSMLIDESRNGQLIPTTEGSAYNSSDWERIPNPFPLVAVICPCKIKKPHLLIRHDIVSSRSRPPLLI